MITQEYNTLRPKLKISNYGRNVTKLIAYALTIENREERNALANNIIEVMAKGYPAVKEHEDYYHVLWNHLMIMSDYKLDVDCPYEIVPDLSISFAPNMLQYKNGDVKSRHYGRSVQEMINEAIKMEEGEERDVLVTQIASTMKRFYVIWNRDSVDDAVILKQLSEMSGDSLHMPEGATLPSTEYILETAVSASWAAEKKKKKKKK